MGDETQTSAHRPPKYPLSGTEPVLAWGVSVLQESLGDLVVEMAAPPGLLDDGRPSWT